MNKVISIIRSKGNFKSKDTGNIIPFDNIIFYLDSGERLYNNSDMSEIILAGNGKPQTIKIKYEDFKKVYNDDPKLLYGKEVHFYTENKELSKLEIKDSK